MKPPKQPATDTLLGYIGRGVETLADEVLRDSISDSVAFATSRDNWTLFGIIAETEFPNCEFDELPSGTFDACVTETLYDDGVRAGRATPIDWLSATELGQLAKEL